MHKFRVWAPRPRRVRLQLGASVLPMDGPDDRGYWSVSVEAAEPGMDYGFLLDEDAMLYPDPRSVWQPHGVHGASRVYGQDAFAWSDTLWQPPPLASAVIYELHVGTFTPEGTLDAAAEKLGYLAKLGVTHVELMPVAEFSGDHGWGYDGVDLFAVHHRYGGPDALKRFVDTSHRAGLAVLLDVVYNHFGPSGNYTGKFGPYVTNRHHTPWGDAINFEAEGSDEVRRFFFDNALMWLREFHIDGLRLDAVHEMMDRSAIHFLEELGTEVETLSSTLGKKFVLIAESDLNNPMLVTPREAHGFGLDAQWSDDFHHALFTVVHPETGGYYDDFGEFASLAQAIGQVFVYDGRYSAYRQRSHGRKVEGLSAHRFVCCIQNHDQVGNRALGERLEHLAGVKRTKVALGILLSAPFVPMLFQGEEFAASAPFQYFADHEDKELARLVAEGRKREFAAFGWDESKIPNPEERETYVRSQLCWDEADDDKHREVLEWTRSLIRLRHSSPALNDGDLRHVVVTFSEDERWLSMERGPVRVLANLGGQPARFEVKAGQTVVLASEREVARKGNVVTVPPEALVIVSSEAADD